MAKLIYLDQNELIRLARKDPPQRAAVLETLGKADAKILLSPAHWSDTASGESDENSRKLARFIDILRPWWLRERISLHQLEINSFLHARPFEAVWQDAVCFTVSETMARLSGYFGGGVAIATAEDIVMHLRMDVGARNIIDRAYSANETAFGKNVADFGSSPMSAEQEHKLERDYLRRIGQITEGSSDDHRLESVPAHAIRSIKVEWEVTKENWREGGVMSRQRFQDLLHMAVALPYANVLVTTDRQMHRIGNRIAPRVPFVTAPMVCSMDDALQLLRRQLE